MTNNLKIAPIVVENAHLDGLPLAIRATNEGFVIYEDDGNINNTRLKRDDDDGTVIVPFPYVRHDTADRIVVKKGFICSSRIDLGIKPNNKLLQMELF